MRIFEQASAPGNPILISKTLTASSVSSAAAVDLTGTAYGNLVLTYAAIRTINAVAPGTDDNTVVLESDNAAGATEILSGTSSALGANSFVRSNTPYVLEAGKKVSIKAGTTTLTTTGNLVVDMIFERLSDGANVQEA